MWRRRASKVGLASLLALSALGAVAAPARAQSEAPSEEDLTAARATFQEGIDLEAEGDWVGALGKFQEVAAVKMTPQVRFHLALCHENLGRWVSAIEGFEAAEKLAVEAGDAPKVAENAPVRAAALKEKVPHVQIEVKGKLRTSRVLLDGTPVRTGQLGQEIAVDVGTHTVTVQRDGKTVSKREITLKEYDIEIVELSVHDDEKAAPVEKKAPEVVPPTEAPSRVPAIVAAGVGVASLGAMGAFIGMRQAAIGDIKDTCRDPDALTGCSPDVQDRVDDGKLAETLAFVFGGVGVAGLGTAAVLWFTASPEAPAAVTRGGRATFAVSATPSGVRLDGRF